MKAYCSFLTIVLIPWSGKCIKEKDNTNIIGPLVQAVNFLKPTTKDAYTTIVNCLSGATSADATLSFSADALEVLVQQMADTSAYLFGSFLSGKAGWKVVSVKSLSGLDTIFPE